MLTNIGVEPVVMEYAPQGEESVPDWMRIREAVSGSNRLLLFKTDNAIGTEWTRSWISFEVGLAANAGKPLFVFERRGPSIKFPIPYLTDYMIFEPDQVADFLKVQKVVKQWKEGEVYALGEPEEIKPEGNLLLSLLAVFAPEVLVARILVAGAAAAAMALYGPIFIKCARCGTSYRYYAGVLDKFQCPVCLTSIELATTAPAETIHFLGELRKLFEQK